MRFVSLPGPQGHAVAGVIQGGQVVDLSHPSCRPLIGDVTPSLSVFIEQGIEQWSRRLIDAKFDVDATQPLSRANLLAPLPRPGKIVGAAFNFTDALFERQMKPPEEPVTFNRSGSTVIGPGSAILLPPDVGNMGYEAELAVIIGRRALRVSREHAMDHVAGYTAHNDISGVDLIKADGGSFVRGKNLPGTSPLGPWLVTQDELPDPYSIGIRLCVDGRLLQNGSTNSMLFDIAHLVSWISHRIPLEPGDIIATGTPAGGAASQQPPAWLVPGTTVTVELDGLGTLCNPIDTGIPFLES